MKTHAYAQQAYGSALLLLVLGCAVGIGAHAAEVLKIGGTGAALGTMQVLGAEFSKSRPELQVHVLPYIGSTGAIKGVASGAISIGLSGRLAKADEEKLNVRLLHYAITPLVFAAHAGVKASGLTRAQVAAIYAGEQTHWQEGGRIRIILRPPNETDNSVLKTVSKDISAALAKALERKGLTSAPTDQDAADAIESTPGALGTTTLSLLVSEKRKLNVLALDGVMPSTKALADGSYPYNKPLYLVVPTSPSPTVNAFVDFVFSPRGQAILAANAHLPVKN